MTDRFDYAFVHGGAQGGWVWHETIAALILHTGGASGRALALDAPGCGTKRERRTDDLTVDDVAHELIDDIERAGMTDVVLVRHSQGGQVMSIMAELRPTLFRRLVYVSCSIPLPGQSVVQMMGTRVQGEHPGEVGWPVDPNLVDLHDRFTHMFCNDMNEQQAASFLSKLGLDSWPPQTYYFTNWRYDHLGRVPATYVLCLRDQSLPPSWQEIFARRLRVEAVIRLDAGHQAMNTRPDELAEILRSEANR